MARADTTDGNGAARPFRFGLRGFMLVVTLFCIAAGMFRFMALAALLISGVLLAQCTFFLIIQRSVNWIAGMPDGEPPASESDEPAIVAD